MGCIYSEILCDENDDPVFVTGLINEITGVLTNINYTNLDGSAYSSALSNLHKCLPTGTIGDTEVGEGNILPFNDSVYELFRLEDHATLPNGLYWWSADAGQWVQV